MIKKYFVLAIFFLNFYSYGQSFAPAPGQVGSTAIHKDSSIITAWASTCSVTRGPMQIDHPEYGLASYGSDIDGVGFAEGNSVNVVSFGDGGSAILTFNPPIKNGFGSDFAIFENGFADHYMEFAFVEVSSNGIDYFRFPAVSQTPLVPQMDNASFGNCAYVHNLAGKYRQGFGTPFDLEDLDSISNLNLNAITHIRLVDVVGITNSTYGTIDAYGNLINDPWPTNFESSGFDLDGIGVINQGELFLSEHQLTFDIAPNPFNNILNLNILEEMNIEIIDQIGKVIYQGIHKGKSVLNLAYLTPGIYFVRLNNGKSVQTARVLKNQ
jgi:hypothetical protein|tara:strand:- start:50293 stop:51267 length:975 start_codon:yes stop_codon:yes gene_type:complete